MAVTEYKDVSWGVENLDIAKLNQMVNNMRYLRERQPKMLYNSYNVRKDVGVKIACGVVTIPRASHDRIQSVRVAFPSFFLPGSKPVVTVGLMSPQNRRVIPTFNGLDGDNSVVDSRGMVVHVAAAELNSKTNYILKTMHLHWIAMGY